jgi:hypothetical protein
MTAPQLRLLAFFLTCNFAVTTASSKEWIVALAGNAFRSHPELASNQLKAISGQTLN